MLKVLDLFAGIGGFSYGLEATGGFETAAFCEIDPFCQKVLKKHWLDVPIHADIKGNDFEQYKGRIDVITGGYPCQPFSNAGKQRGEEDPRHLWPSMREVIKQVRPTWVICENVHGHIKLGLDKVLLDLENIGYTTRTFIVPACGVNAPHRRNRLWIIAYTKHNGSSSSTEQGENNGNARKSKEGQEQSIEPAGIYSSETVANSTRKRPQKRTEKPLLELAYIQIEFQRGDQVASISPHQSKPRIYGTCDGVSDRVDRIKALGNSVVPQIVFNIGKAILHAEEKNAKG